MSPWISDTIRSSPHVTMAGKLAISAVAIANTMLITIWSSSGRLAVIAFMSSVTIPVPAVASAGSCAIMAVRSVVRNPLAICMTAGACWAIPVIICPTTPPAALINPGIPSFAKASVSVLTAPIACGNRVVVRLSEIGFTTSPTSELALSLRVEIRPSNVVEAVSMPL